ncbi:MAG: prepilin-type N-terminal cleavage/methylation domain-containing protein [Phycisphaerales bacterium]|nr:prepilin-type N-terminal cleavage/methylation domain-containing protein [bacterium]
MHDFRTTSRARRGFTLVELLVVFVVILILVGILVVALSGAVSSARRSKTVAQLQSISTAIDAFETDFRYVPPLVTPELVSPDSSPTRTGLVTPRTHAQAAGNPNNIDQYYRDARYNSEFSLTVYLLGIGALNPDELDDDGVAPGSTPLHDGVPGPGFKAPGNLRAWKVQPSSGPIRHEPQLTGRTYGPYLDFGTLEGVVDFDEDRGMFRILDPWGNPVRYYSGWNGFRIVNGNRQPTLDEIPIELRSSEGLEAELGGANLAQLLDFDDELRTAKYALLSAGESSDDYYGTNPYTGEQNTFIAPFGDVVFESNGSTSLVDTYSALNQEQQVSFLKQVGSNLRYIK